MKKGHAPNPATTRLRLTIAYDGAPYKGWQSQPFGITVQDTLEEVLRKVAKCRVILHAAGRTDTGVHALAQCAHADVPAGRPAAEWMRILNHQLPPSIRIRTCSQAGTGFHARHSAQGKVYRYLIRNAGVQLPHEAGRAWLVPGTLDFELLEKSAKVFEGRHDFSGFALNKSSPGETVRTIRRVSVARRGSLVTLTFEGEGFLYRMVRMLTGAIVRVAQHEDEPVSISHRLHHPSQPVWAHCAPACGLYLVRVLY